VRQGVIHVDSTTQKRKRRYSHPHRTLTNLYNERPTWLDLAHRKLDEAVFSAPGWDPSLTDDEILARLLALNQERASATSAGP
jgi:hypothetical protein